MWRCGWWKDFLPIHVPYAVFSSKSGWNTKRNPCADEIQTLFSEFNPFDITSSFLFTWHFLSRRMHAFCVLTTRCSLAIVSPSRGGGEGEEGPTTLRLTRTRFCLKTQLFRHGYGFCPHASHENDHWKRNFSKSSREWNILTTLYSRVRMDGRNRNFARMWRHTISANRPCAMLQTYSRWRAGASLSCLYDFSLFHT